MDNRPTFTLYGDEAKHCAKCFDKNGDMENGGMKMHLVSMKAMEEPPHARAEIRIEKIGGKAIKGDESMGMATNGIYETAKRKVLRKSVQSTMKDMTKSD